MERAIILGARELGYQIIKALGKEGIVSIVIYGEERDEIGQYSKYAQESYEIPNFFQEPHRLLDFLTGKRKEWNGTIIIPTDDYGVKFLSAHKDTLSNHYIIPSPGAEIIDKIVNKKSLYKIAQEMGIFTPRLFSPRSLKELEAIKSQILYPCLIKPGLGHLFFREFDCKMLEAHNYDELQENYRRFTDDFRRDDYALTICEIVPGQDSEYMIQFDSYLDTSGELLALMTTRKIRLDPPRYGQGRITRSERIDDVNEISVQLLKALGYSGFSEIEWKYDYRDGKYKLIEINPRFIFYIGLCVECGINFPYIQYQDLVHHRKVRVSSYREDIYWIHFYKDVLHTLLNHNMEDFSVFEYLKPYLKKKAFAIFDFRDPLPFFQQWRLHIGNMIRKGLSV
jgi:predicted ATP-grasp superfamily ATP-dependent carboligase